MNTPVRVCTVCGRELPATLEYFSLHSGNKKLRAQCRKCYNQKIYTNRWAHPEQCNAYRREHYRQNAEHYRSYKRANDRIHRAKRRVQLRLRYWRSPDRYREMARKDYAAHAEQRITSAAKWQKANPKRRKAITLKRQARKAALPAIFTDTDWQRCLDYWGTSCAYCGNQTVRICADHYIPLNSPNCPGTIPGNIVPACVSCNSSKQDTDPIEWLKQKFGEIEAKIKQSQIETYLCALR